MVLGIRSRGDRTCLASESRAMKPDYLEAAEDYSTGD